MDSRTTGIEHVLDVIVVGGGIMGSCTAYQTSMRGYSTLLLDQFDFLHNRGSSHGESRTIRVTYPEPYYSSMVLESSKLWEEAQSQVGYRVLYPTNQLDIGKANDRSLQAVIRSCQSNSVDFRVLDHNQVTQEFSGGVTVPEDWIGVVSRGAGVIKPTKAVCMFQTLALLNGAILKDNMKVVDISRDMGSGCIVVSTATGEKFYGRKCVVAAGAWMNKLVKAVTGREVPIQPLETTICYWRIKEEYERDFSIDGRFPSFAGYGSPYIYGTPSLEYPSLIKVGVHGGRFCDPDKRTWIPDPELMDLLKLWVKERFGGRVEHDRPVSSQSCMYSMTPDEDYVIDFLGGEFGKNVVIAGGFSGHGFKMGPVIGRVVADLVLLGEAKGVEMEHFKLARFDENPKGNIKEFAVQVGTSKL
ncbi:probable sarcosine oxidase [Chenopodium quinoa]|uniref:FAD dependent oxidoreductase domain-containing protein n=1 Tax=Chenopodium quinoa TaxID=63459 RepID=A0A803LXT9_CHEQI|nr:probable sarcosine oxidase [Chenopodium quinoa]XP_021755581.1 probable sarcosine oxidase [Chenopodium quinoa]